MKLTTVSTSQMGANTYLISTENTAVIIDPGFMCSEIRSFIIKNEGKEFAILLTHNHFDHIGGANEARSLSKGKIYISKADERGLYDNEINLSDRFMTPLEPFKADVIFDADETLAFSDLQIKTLWTPGHSMGSTCFFINDWLFSGDVLFRQSIGRTDFICGDNESMVASLLKLASLEGDYDVYPGHGEATRLSYEKQFNPYIREVL